MHPKRVHWLVERMAGVRSRSEIAEATGLTPGQVTALLCHKGLKSKRNIFKPDGILADYDAGMLVTEIAAKHGCSITHVSYLARKHGRPMRGRGKRPLTVR